MVLEGTQNSFGPGGTKGGGETKKEHTVKVELLRKATWVMKTNRGGGGQFPVHVPVGTGRGGVKK